MTDTSQRTPNEENPAEERPPGQAPTGTTGQFPAAQLSNPGNPAPAGAHTQLPPFPPTTAGDPAGQVPAGTTTRLPPFPPTTAGDPAGQAPARTTTQLPPFPPTTASDPAGQAPAGRTTQLRAAPFATAGDPANQLPAAITAGPNNLHPAIRVPNAHHPVATDEAAYQSPFPEPRGSTPWVDPRRAARLANTEPWHRDGTGPVPTASGPVRKRWRKIAFRTLAKSWGDSLFGMSSQAAFWSALSTAPLLLALLGLSGYVARLIGPNTTGDIRQQVNIFLHTIFDEEVADNLIGNTVDVILNNSQADVISVGLIISLWAGSSAMTAFVESICIAYCQHEFRHPVLERFFALGLYVGALAAGIFVVPLLAIGPDYLPKLFPAEWRGTVTEILGWVYYPGLAIGLILLLTTLYKVAPKHKHRWMRGLPGAFLAAAVFLVASTGLRLYLSYVYEHGLTYGALATPITFLLFYYFISMAIIIGAQFNNALLEYYPPRLSSRARRRREKSSADEVAEGRLVPAGPPVAVGGHSK